MSAQYTGDPNLDQPTWTVGEPYAALMVRLFRMSAVAIVVCLTATSCSGGDEEAAPPTTASTTTTADPGDPVGPPPEVKVTPIAELDRPTAMAQVDGSDVLYIAEQGGTIRTIEGGNVNATPVLDISSEVSDGGERGLLGLAFAPKKRLFYVNYTDNDGNTNVAEYQLDNGGRADLRSRRQILFVEQPFANHNGGQLAFGPEGALYIGLGDGGGAGDPNKNAQNLSVLLGKILRIRPDAPSEGLPYTVPFDNPFADQPGARGEIWAYGLRNPWRFSFDPETQGLWVADVGQNKREEINNVAFDQRGGANYGWPLREGSLEFDGEPPSDAVEPVHEYGRDNGACSVTGGYVYRGEMIPDLTARYIFGDFCTGEISVLTQRGTGWEADPLDIEVPSIAAFGTDRNGEIYVLSLSGDVGRIDTPDT